MKILSFVCRRQTPTRALTALLMSVVLCGSVVSGSGCGSSAPPAASFPNGSAPSVPFSTPPSAASSGRGFPESAPWVSCYGAAAQMGDLEKAARTFRIINVDADPDVGNFTPAQITQLKAGGRNRVISYLNLGACETFRSYWRQAPPGFVACRDNGAAQRGPYAGYPDETWMDVGNVAYQHLVVDYVAPRLAAQGVDGFFFDNLEIMEHGPADKNGPCDATCRQGGLDLVRKLREKYPNLLFVMQNATSDVTRLGQTGGKSFPTLLDGISHEEVYTPQRDAQSEQQLLAWKGLNLTPGGKTFWIGTEDYVGNCTNTAAAGAVYAASRVQGFSPYVSDASATQQQVCYWPF